MPKDRRSPSVDRCSRVSPYSRNYQDVRMTRPRTPSLPVGNENEWEETRCPICMEHPHNAVLLLCSSLEKGCRPYMCSTNDFHSNCLAQFRKSSMNADASPQVHGGEETKLVCPLCRGEINGWKVVNPARRFMDSKVRSCSLETCDFSGNYSQLKKHARCEHPNVRPRDVDPERELEWRSLEEELEQQDVVTIQLEYVDVDDNDEDDDYDNDEFMAGVVPDLNYPIVLEHEFSSLLDPSMLDSDNIFSAFEHAVDSNLYLEDIFSSELFVSGPGYTHNRLPVSSRESELTNFYNRSSAGLRENGPTYFHNRLPERSRVHGPFDTNIMLSERPRAYGQTDTHNMLSGRPRRYGPSDGHNRFSGTRGYGPNTRSNTHHRRGSNGQPSSLISIPEDQLSTIVVFHDLSSNRH
uniref:uncharacterized protein LOC122597813 n=1 Tax=Erigeron canadensis TaxID=72917 RepID=UPI001CB92045|nr:uncharacterized protein LOC122597813 [Erigeron canadensis]